MSFALITGAGSGLGAYLARTVPHHTVRFNRMGYRPQFAVPKDGYELIIHAAFGMPTTQESERDYVNSQIHLANSVLRLPSKRYIFISSIDVLNSGSLLTIYARAKLEVEAVFGGVKSALILRPGALIGHGMRDSQLMRIIRGDKLRLTLSKLSTFHIVFYDDVLSAISDLTEGVYVLAARRTVSLQEVADKFQRAPSWGSHEYLTVTEPFKCPVYRNSALESIDPIDRLKRFVKMS